MVGRDESTQSVTVVAAVIRDTDERVLLTRRPQGRHMGGLWEFPGGKVNAGESPPDALVRECREELGIEIEIENPLTFAMHEETALRVLLLFYRARITSGEPHGHEGQAVCWVPVDELPSYPTPPADAELVRQLAGRSIP